ncbi:unnamed protein product (macronuclear) [Paramecium tetraurelia]|uniref:Transmembrane protein n=1 Tax=Paramecium tetraurelia TaxID=5888 RepID=A0D5L0_PARTE|nr:uncharacterized protein GSPATT00013757001 [Paramecium tetraurelia]CAK78327.1 unnamed protein product [Paramecium tetraurelia]|eukprot:XP_001445724.1 hypothetical protein (macronuclear) [Paramecium tetraurelia strain d4-2]
MSPLTITTLILFKLLQVVHLKLINNTYFIFENEYIQTSFPVLSIPLDFDISNQSQTQSLIQEYNLTEEYKYPIAPKAKLFSFKKSNNEDIDIVQLEDQKLTLLYQIKNYQSNNQLLIRSGNYSISLTQRNCFSLHYLQEESYLLACKLPEHKIEIQILNLNQQSSEEGFTNKTLNILDYNPLCELESNLAYSLLVIFEKNCSYSKLETIFIDAINQKIINQTKFVMDEYNKSNEFITKIQICSTTTLMIYTNNEILKLDLEQQDFSNFLFFNQEQYFNAKQCTDMSIVEVRDNQLKFNQFSLNVSIEGFIQGFRLNIIFILQKKDHVIVYYSYNLQLIIRKSFQQLFSLSNLPYILGVTEKGEHLIYRIKNPRFSFTYKNSSKIQILEYEKQPKFQKLLLDQIISDVEILSESSPQFLIQNNTQFFGSFEGSRFKIHQNQIQKSLPFKIKQLYINDTLINFKEETKLLGCNIDIRNLKQISILSLEDDSFLILFIQNDATQIVIARCTENKLQNIKTIKIQEGFIQIMNFNLPRVCIVQENSLKIYQFENQQLLERSYAFNLNIIAAYNMNNTNILGLVFEDCNQRTYFIDNHNLQIHQIISQQLECNGNKQKLTPLFFIDEHKIFFKNQVSYQEQIILKETIIKAEVMLQHRKILIFTQYQQKLKIKFYSFISFELQLLYDCPLYNFNLKVPLNYKLQSPFLLVLAENSQQNSVLLIYNLNNQAINSLIQIIEIDQEHFHFDFIFGTLKSFYYYYQNDIQIRDFETYTLFLENQIPQTSVFKVLHFSFAFQTPILNEIINWNFTEKSINNDYTIMLIQNDTLSLNSNNILDMSNIFSNIISIEVIQQNYQLIRPLRFTHEKMTCKFYQNKCCLNDHNLECLQNNQRLFYVFHYVFQFVHTIYFNDNNSECIIISTYQENLQMIIISFQNYSSSIKPQIFQYEIITDPVLHKGTDLQIIFADRDHVIFLPDKINKIFVYLKLQPAQQLFFNYSNQKNTLLYGSRIKDDDYVFLYQSQDDIFYSIVTISINKKNEQQKIFIKNQMQDQICISNNEFIEPLIGFKKIFPNNFQKIQIIELTLVDDVLVIELLMLFEIQIGFVIQLRIDIIKYGKCEINILQTLRYPHNSLLSRPFYVNKDYIIISTCRINIESLILYDRFQGQNISLIHSIDVFPQNDYLKIEKINNSHVALVAIPNIFQEVQIIALSQYKLECLNNCNSTATLILKNEVSKLTITVQNINNEIPLQYNIRLITLITNLLTIQLFLQLRNKKNKK